MILVYSPDEEMAKAAGIEGSRNSYQKIKFFKT
jgi:hypothetical protein